MTDQDTFRKDGIVFPAGQIDVSGFEARYASFQRQSVAPRGKETNGQLGEVDANGNLYQAYDAGQRTTDDNCMFPFAHLKDDYKRIKRFAWQPRAPVLPVPVCKDVCRRRSFSMPASFACHEHCERYKN